MPAGEGSPKLEQRIASLAATGAKLARRLEADGHTGGMWAVLDHETHEIKAIGADLRANIDRVRASLNG